MSTAAAVVVRQLWLYGNSMATATLQEKLGAKIDDLADAIINLAEVNSGSYNPAGVNECGERLAHQIEPLEPDEIEAVAVGPSPSVDSQGRRVEHDVGKVLRARKRPEAPFQICMFGHLDTVFGVDHPFQKVKRDGTRLHGPGVTDCKGGLVTAVEVLRHLEQTEWCTDVGWEYLAIPDEEIGSVGSIPILAEAAERCNIGLGFEPALPSGAIVAERRGTMNVYAVVHGAASHAGRARHEGRSAIRALAALVEILESCNEQPGITANCGWVTGGSDALNIVPDFAAGGCDIRISKVEDREWVRSKVETAAEAVSKVHELDIELIWTSGRLPKLSSPEFELLIEDACQAGAAIGEELVVENSGGASDGNILSGYGLPNIDSLGICGQGIHSDSEFADVASVPARAEIAFQVIKRACARYMENN